MLIEVRPYGKEEEEEADKEIEDVPEVWSLPSKTLTRVPAPVPFIVVAEVAARQRSEVPSSLNKILRSCLPSIFFNDQSVEGEEEEERETNIPSHLR